MEHVRVANRDSMNFAGLPKPTRTANASWIIRGSREIRNRAIYRVEAIDTNELLEFQFMRTLPTTNQSDFTGQTPCHMQKRSIFDVAAQFQWL
jgi:hypothetical protein